MVYNKMAILIKINNNIEDLKMCHFWQQIIILKLLYNKIISLL